MNHLHHHDLVLDETTAIVEQRFCGEVIAISTDRLGGVKAQGGRKEQGKLCGDGA